VNATLEKPLGNVVVRRPVGEVCPLCGGEGEPVGVVEGVCVRTCCGTLLSWAWESEEAYTQFYADIAQFHEGQQEREGHPTTIARDAEHLKASRNRVKTLSALYLLPYETQVLDVGAGGGSFVAACREMCWQAFGIEPCRALAEWACAQGRPVSCIRWQDYKATGFNVIALHDVLEHLTEPIDCLLHLQGALVQGGTIVVEMPEWESAQAKREGLNWRHVAPQQHVCLYSDSAAQELFRRCGLAVEAMVRPLRGEIGKITYYLGREP
jgi:hypothetical protein